MMSPYEPPTITELGSLQSVLAENASLKKQVNELQTANTRLLEERRAVDERYMVEHFHRIMSQPVLIEPQVPDEERVRLRARLIAEEFVELMLSLFEDPDRDLSEADGALELMIKRSPLKVNIVEFADACADLKYVVVGSEIEFGIDGRPVFKGVHEANLRKVGGPRRVDGKVQKPESWHPFDVTTELRRQGWKG